MKRVNDCKAILRENGCGLIKASSEGDYLIVEGPVTFYAYHLSNHRYLIKTRRGNVVGEGDNLLEAVNDFCQRKSVNFNP